MTKGEYRVGTSFNPSGNSYVDSIKDQAAKLIDLVEAIHPDDTNDVGRTAEVFRLKALAQTAIEEGAMWAVKAATKGPRE